jgi:hypothetical protein
MSLCQFKIRRYSYIEELFSTLFPPRAFSRAEMNEVTQSLLRRFVVYLRGRPWSAYCVSLRTTASRDGLEGRTTSGFSPGDAVRPSLVSKHCTMLFHDQGVTMRRTKTT